MYKWHVNSAFGRGRPLGNDFARVSDAIAASLRQFSVSVARAAEDGDGDKRPGFRVQRSREAVNEVSSLARPSRGIDARSLAASPPQGLRITRTIVESGDGKGSILGSKVVNRAVGPNMRGRRVARGGRGGRGRGKASGGRDSKSDEENAKDLEEGEKDFTDEEIKELDLIHGGEPTPYEPTTESDYLASPVLSSARGLVENIKYKMQVATSNTNGVHKIGGEHLARMTRGDGTFFESLEAKTIVQDFNNQIRKERAEEFGWEYKPAHLTTLPEDQRKILAKTWAAGHHEAPKTAELDDVFGQVESYVRRNETYLPEHKRKLEEKLRTLLPAQYQKSEPKEPTPQPL